MIVPIPKSIQTFIDETPVTKILEWLKALLTFYIKPRRFFNNYYKQEAKNQVKQVVLYIVIFVLFFWLVSGFSKLDNLKLIISIFLITLPLSSVQYLVARILKVPPNNAVKCFSFVFIGYLLCQIPVLILSWLFLTNEDYTLMLWSNFIAAISFFFIIFFFWHILELRVKHIFAAYLLMILFLNIGLAIITVFRVPGKDSNDSSDSIIAELNHYTEEIKDYSGVPFMRIITYQRGIGDYDSLTVRKNDSVFHYGKDGIELYKKLATTNVIKLDSILKIVHFKKNKAALQSLRRYYFLMSGYFDYHPCDTCLVESTTYTDTVRKLIIRKTNKYVIDSNYLKSYYDFQKQAAVLAKSAGKADTPNEIPALIFLPDILLFSWLGKTPVNINTQFMNTAN